MDQEVERWLPAPINGSYEVSNMGRVRSFRNGENGRILNIQTHNLGYKKVSIVDDSVALYSPRRWRSFYLHVLIAQTWIPNPNNLPEVNHLDRNKANNAVLNLEWCTHKQNIIHSYLTRITPKGKDHHRFGKKASKEQRELMRDQKLGENHPKFIGWYMHKKTNVKYASANQAGAAHGIDGKTVKRRSKHDWSDWLFIPKVTTNQNVIMEIEIAQGDTLVPETMQ